MELYLAFNDLKKSRGDVTNLAASRRARKDHYNLFFYKDLFYKNVEAEIYQNFKNMLRTYPRLRERLYFAHLG